MARAQVPFHALNAGEVSPDALMRVDLEKMKLASETMDNVIPTVLGPVQFRPGTRYIGATEGNDKARLIRFVGSATETALLEVTENGLKVWRDDALVTIPSVTTTITNGLFNSALSSGWTDLSGTGATATVASGQLVLTGGSFETARVRNAITIGTGDENTRHWVNINVAAGPVIFRAGSTAGSDNRIAETELGTGYHMLSWVPSTGTTYVEFEVNQRLARKVEGISIASSGDLVVTTPWADADLVNIKTAQSADVIFAACDGYQPYQIERRDWYSWSCVRYETSDGPWRQPESKRVTLTPGAVSGITTLTASRALFRSSLVGALFRLTHRRQYQDATLTDSSQQSPPIKVIGVKNDRDFILNISGTWTGEIWLERSFDDPDGEYIKYHEFTTNQTNQTINDVTGTGSGPSSDANNNQITYYRLAIANNVAFTGSAVVSLASKSGSQVGICRVLALTSSTVVDIEVIKPFSRAEATDLWRESEWSDFRGWPTAVGLYEGRLWWGRGDNIWGSGSDDFTNFDPYEEGDAAAISRNIGAGPVEGINWILPLSRLVVGTALSEVVVRSSSLDEPLTPANFAVRSPSTRGSSSVEPVSVDGSGIFVQRNGRKIYELIYDGSQSDYVTNEVTRLNPEIMEGGCLSMAVQRHPDTRIWFVKSDGEIAVLTYEPKDSVVGWSNVDIGGVVEEVCSLPSGEADDIYVVVRRTIDGSTVRYIEKFMPEVDAIGATENWMADCATTGTLSSGSPGPETTIGGLDHLEGEDVIVWSSTVAARRDQSNMETVSGGGITIPVDITDAIVGLPYTGRIKTVKLAYASEAGTALSQKKAVRHLGIIARHIGLAGVQIGKTFSKLYSLPSTVRGVETASTDVQDDYDVDMASFDGGWDTDSRVCIEFAAPYPAKILGLVIDMETSDRVK